MNKKGASIIIFIFELVLVISLVSVTSFAAIKLSSDETLVQMNLANDIKMMVDVLVGVPGEVVVEVPYETSKYTIILRQDLVEVIVGNEMPIQKYLSLPSGFRAAKKIENVKRVCLVKKERIITMRACEENES